MTWVVKDCSSDLHNSHTIIPHGELVESVQKFAALYDSIQHDGKILDQHMTTMQILFKTAAYKPWAYKTS